MSRNRGPWRGKRGIIALCCLLAGLVLLGLQINRTQLWEERAAYAGWHVQEHVLTGSCRLLDPEAVVRVHGTEDDCSAALARIRSDQDLAPASDHLVVLLHGMGRSPWIFKEMESAKEETERLNRR